MASNTENTQFLIILNFWGDSLWCKIYWIPFDSLWNSTILTTLFFINLTCIHLRKDFHNIKFKRGCKIDLVTFHDKNNDRNLQKLELFRHLEYDHCMSVSVISSPQSNDSFFSKECTILYTFIQWIHSRWVNLIYVALEEK